MALNLRPPIRAVATGLTAFIVDLLLLRLLHGTLQLNLRLSLLVAYLGGFAVSYFGNKSYVFASDLPHSRTLSRYLMLSALNLLTSIFLVPLLVRAGNYYLFSKTLVVGLMFAINFMVGSRYIFNIES